MIISGLLLRPECLLPKSTSTVPRVVGLVGISQVAEAEVAGAIMFLDGYLLGSIGLVAVARMEHIYVGCPQRRDYLVLFVS